MISPTLKIALLSGLHHGSGFGLSGLVDRAVLRDSDGIPYFAASAIKGKLRHNALRVLLSGGSPACHTGDGPSWCDDAAPCCLCSAFGSPRLEGALLFCDAYPFGETSQLLAELAELSHASSLYRDSSIRARTSIDRKLGTARPRLLYTTEVLPEFLVFTARIHGDVMPHLSLLQKACTLTTHIGADGARGLGRCKIQLVDGESL